MQKSFDIVLYGATGFTGKLVARYLARNGGGGLRVALAGRSAARLRDVRDECAADAAASSWDPAVIACDAEDAEGLAKMARQARVVISTAGPFSLCGTPIVGACAAAGTHYVDINGETPWVRDMIDRFDATAAATGALIVPNCGFTVPSDLAAHHAAQLLAERHGGATSSVRALVQFNGRLSGGTMHTGILLDEASAEVQLARRDPFLLGGAPAGGARPEDDDATAAEYDASLEVWTAPFWMSEISSRVVRRSSALFRAAGPSTPSSGARAPRVSYADDFRYKERALARDEGVARNLAAPTPPPARRQRLIDRGKLPAPGQGPSEEVRRKSWFRNLVVGEAAPDAGGGNALVLTSVQGGDPGYDETAKMVASAAMLLARGPDALPRLPRADGSYGGVLTPAFALGAPLRSMLHERGVEFREHPVASGAALAEELRRVAAEEPPGRVGDHEHEA